MFKLDDIKIGIALFGGGVKGDIPSRNAKST